MNPLHLSGYGVKIRIDSIRPKSQLVIEDGRQDFKKGQTFKFRPRKISYDSIIIDGHSGYISLQAFHWLSKNKIPVHILNFEGSLISSILPPMPVKADLRIGQIEASKIKILNLFSIYLEVAFSTSRTWLQPLSHFIIVF